MSACVLFVILRLQIDTFKPTAISALFQLVQRDAAANFYQVFNHIQNSCDITLLAYARDFKLLKIERGEICYEKSAAKIARLSHVETPVYTCDLHLFNLIIYLPVSSLIAHCSVIQF